MCTSSSTWKNNVYNARGGASGWNGVWQKVKLLLRLRDGHISFEFVKNYTVEVFPPSFFFFYVTRSPGRQLFSPFRFTPHRIIHPFGPRSSSRHPFGLVRGFAKNGNRYWSFLQQYRFLESRITRVNAKLRPDFVLVKSRYRFFIRVSTLDAKIFFIRIHASIIYYKRRSTECISDNFHADEKCAWLV